MISHKSLIEQVALLTERITSLEASENLPAEVPDGCYVCDRHTYSKLLYISRQLTGSGLGCMPAVEAGYSLEKILTENFDVEECDCAQT